MDRARPRHRALAVALATLLVPLLVGSVSAAKAPKINVCHLDRVTSTYTLNTISQSGLAKHLAHGDGLPGEGELDENCQPVPPPARVFAIAFTNVDGIAGFDPATDVLIAEVVDGNGNSTLDVGDTVTSGAYPLDFAGSSFGGFGVTSWTVTSVLYVAADRIDLGTSEIRYTWWDQSGIDMYDEWATEQTLFVDAYASTTDCDLIRANTGSPSQPDTEGNVSTCDASQDDDGFLDVIIAP